MTPDLTRDSYEGELALSPAFPVCVGSEKMKNVISVSPAYAKILVFQGGV